MTNSSAQKRRAADAGDPPATLHSRDVVICNEKGLHARASAKFADCAGRFDADIVVMKDALTVSATSIMGLLMLAASKGSTLRLTGSGPDAVAALDALSALVEDGFGESA